MKNLIILFSVFFSTHSFAKSYLQIYNIPAPQNYNWETPRSAYWSLHANVFNGYPATDERGNSMSDMRGRSLGHNYVSLKCTNSDGGKVEMINGMTMTGYPSDYRGEFHWIGGRGKYGMAILFNDYSGRLDVRDGTENADLNNLKKDLNARKTITTYKAYDPNTNQYESRRALSFIRFEVSDDECMDLMNYYEDFKRHGGNNHYGFMFHPLNSQGELNIGPRLGSGCSEFAASFLERSHRLSLLYKRSWQRTLFIPKSLIGTAQRSVRRSTMQNNRLPWGSREDQEHERLTFWDPELMHQWVLKTYENNDGIYLPVKEGEALGIELPLSSPDSSAEVLDS